MSVNKITSGTKEWADTNVNCYYGCSNDCIYCYAKKMAIRFGRKTEENWKIMEPNWKAMEKGYGNRQGRIMFPTSHDITENSEENCFYVLQKLLKVGNEVLITTKPYLKAVKRICDELSRYKNQIQFRFTITSLNQWTLNEYEPSAPSFVERISALVYAAKSGYKTSISIEPFLDMNPIPLIIMVAPYATESIWLGKLNYMKRNFNTRTNIEKILKSIEILPGEVKSKIRLKDSIRNLMKKHGEI